MSESMGAGASTSNPSTESTSKSSGKKTTIVVKEGMTGRSGTWSGQTHTVQVDLDSTTGEELVKKLNEILKRKEASLQNIGIYNVEDGNKPLSQTSFDPSSELRFWDGRRD